MQLWNYANVGVCLCSVTLSINVAITQSCNQENWSTWGFSMFYLGLRSLQRWPHLAAYVRPGHTFPISMHSDEGTGHAQEPCMVVSWSPVWASAAFGFASLPNDVPYKVLLNKIPIIVCPKKETAKAGVLKAVLAIAMDVPAPWIHEAIISYDVFAQHCHYVISSEQMPYHRADVSARRMLIFLTFHDFHVVS